MKINNTLQNLLNQQNIALKNDELCITIYHNIENPSKNVIRTEIRDLAYNYLKKFAKTEEIILRDIADQLAEIVYAQEIYKSSMGVFARINLNTDSKTPILELNQNLFFIFANTQIEEYGYAGKIFSLTSAIKMIQQDSNSLVINIAREKVQVFKSNDSDFYKILEFTPVILEAMEDRYTGRHSTGESTFAHQGGGEDEKKDKFATTILNELFEKFDKLNAEQKNSKRILIFCSADFSPHSGKIIESLKKYSTFEPTVIQKTLKLDNDVKDHAKVEIENIRNLNKEDDLESLKTGTSGTFAEDWENVSQAAREARIYKLYIKEGFHEPGFLMNNDLPYINKEENTESMNNIGSWIIKKVFETGGEVVALDKENTSIEYPVFAALRF